MMLEMVEPSVTYLQIIRAAAIPAILYYFSLLLVVHFHSKRIGATDAADAEPEKIILSRPPSHHLRHSVWLVASRPTIRLFSGQSSLALLARDSPRGTEPARYPAELARYRHSSA